VVAAVIVLAAIIGVVVYVLLSTQNVVQTPVTPQVPIATVPSTSATGSATSTGVVPPVADVTNRDIFTPRNPFEVIKPPKIGSATASTTSTSTSTSTSSSSSDSTTLTLKDITSVDGEKAAVVRLGGTTYTVKKGETVGTSSWKVVSIGTSSVVFLYGDDRVTISLGQGTSK